MTVLRRFADKGSLNAAIRQGVRVRFKCPKCGGRAFGSGMNSRNELERLCHGNDAGDGRHGCRFAWHSRDDHKYFYVESGR